MKKILATCFATPLFLAALFITIMLASSCGSSSDTPVNPASTANTTPVVKYPVYQMDCNSVATNLTMTTVVAQARWDTSTPTPRLVSESFTPRNLTIPVNTVVKWVNNDNPGVVAPAGTWNGYNIYSDGWLITDINSSTTATATTVSAYIGPLPPNNTLCLQFPTPGTYNYHCDVKTGAVGAVTVVP